jgi:hypothetical protein
MVFTAPRCLGDAGQMMGAMSLSIPLKWIKYFHILLTWVSDTQF